MPNSHCPHRNLGSESEYTYVEATAIDPDKRYAIAIATVGRYIHVAIGNLVGGGGSCPLSPTEWYFP
jgi:hypothetical protein